MSARPRRGRWAALLAIVVVVIAVLLIVFEPFHTSGKASAGVADNSTPTSLTTVKRQSLSSQTQVDGTLGYAGSSKILVPSGNASTAVQQSEQQLASGEAQLASAQSSLASDGAALQRARSQLAAARAKEAVDCAGEGAAEAGSSAGGGSGTCAGDRQTVTSGEQGVSGAEAKVAADRTQLASAQSSLAHSSSALATARSTAVGYAQGAVYTWLPSVGEVIARNHNVYAIGGQPTILLYGRTLATRAFLAGMSAGPDVAELNANLEALGYGSGLSGEEFSAATATAIRAFQAAHGLAQTGELALGSVVFEPAAVRVTSVTPTVGMNASPGPALAVSSTARQVVVKLDASQQSSVKDGDRVLITLPDGQTTPGTVSYVASVAVAPPSEHGEESTPTIEVDITPDEPQATGHLEAAPVQVSITTASVESALVVPVTALLALAGGGYAVEEVQPDGAHRLVAVTLGLFDDEAGDVQVSGPELAAGQSVVVPST
ncbi:MAG TPA: peptidoglycan-binding domain-containing protein [Solirubrobacteraceae bacterium]|nr:peptidoglycan-binding domain-containing protein [Solirubrobacteraceae bacterium]